jgi:hypothetical protein
LRSSNAQTWTGKLFDAGCVEQRKNEQKIEACTPTSGTASFAINFPPRPVLLTNILSVALCAT